MSATDRTRDASLNEILAAVSQAVGWLVDYSNPDQQIARALEVLGQATKADRAYMFENYTDGKNQLCTRQLYEWCRPGIRAQKDNPALQHVEIGRQAPRFVSLLRAGESIQGMVADLEEGERALLEFQDILSLVIVPIISESALWGFIGLDDCTAGSDWGRAVLDALRTVADIIGSLFARSRWESALTHSEQQWRIMFDRTQDIILIIDPEEGEILRANRAVFRLLGYEPETLLGKNPAYLMPAQCADQGEHILRSTADQSHGVTLPFLRFDGGHCIMDVRVTTMPWQGSTALLATLRDVTEREHTEEMLRHNEERFRRMFEQTPVSLWERDYSKVILFLDSLNARGVVDLEAHFRDHPGDLIWCLRLMRNIDVNRESLLLFRAPDKRTLLERYAEVYGADLACNLLRELQALRGGKGSQTNIECNFQALDGTNLAVLTRWTAVPGSASSFGHVVVSYVDITGRREAEQEARERTEQLLRAEKIMTLGTLISGVAHEINNPNSFISLNVPLLQEAWEHALPILDAHQQQQGDFSLGLGNYGDLRDEIRVLFEDVLEGTARIRDVVKDLRDFARHNPAGERSLLDMNQVVRSAVSLLRANIAHYTRSFRVEYDPALPPVLGHKQSLERVLIDLIMNACQSLAHKDASLTIRLECDHVRNELAVSLEDQGCGMTREVLAQVCDPFFTTKREAGHTGLGLSVSSKIMEEHHGRMEFESEPGRGTVARMVLPLAS